MTDARVIKAAAQLLQEKTVTEVHCLLPKDAVMKAATTAGIDLGKFGKSVVFLETDLPKVSATETPLIQAGELLHAKLVDAVISGAVYTTADVIRAAISSVGLAPGCRTVSGAFFMNRGTETYLFADCGVVIEPTLNQLIDISTASIQTWRKIMPAAHKPVVAFLSFSTHGSAKSDRAEKMAAAFAAFKERHPEIDCEGEIQFDAAIDAAVGQKKCPGSKVPGKANCFIFPNLDAGNIAYKITQRLAGFFAYGPILQGTAKPFSDLSRGATTEDILVSTYINLVRAQ
jgi:phosphate acetyltransferase